MELWTIVGRTGDWTDGYFLLISSSSHDYMLPWSGLTQFFVFECVLGACQGEKKRKKKRKKSKKITKIKK